MIIECPDKRNGTFRGISHMHHRFAIFDSSQVLTGSYNWTRAAAKMNHENIAVSNDPRLVRRFSSEFQRMLDVF